MSGFSPRASAASKASTNSSRERARESGGSGLIVALVVEEGAQPGPDLLKAPLDGALGTAGLLGDLGHLVALDAQLQHQALLLWQLFEGLGDGQLQDGVGDFVMAAGVLEVVAGVGDGDPDVALAGAVERFGGPDAVEGDDQEQPPQLLAGRHVVVALADAAEEAPEDRLHDVVRLDAPGQLGGAASLDQGTQAVRVAH